MTLIFAAAFTMSNLLDALEDEEHNILCRWYILFLWNCLDLTELLQCVIMRREQKKGRQSDCRLSAARCDIPINFTLSYYIKNTNLSRLFTGYRVLCSKKYFDGRTEQNNDDE